MVLEKKKAVLDMVHDVNTVYLENDNKIIEFTGDDSGYSFEGILLTYGSDIKLAQEVDKLSKIVNYDIVEKRLHELDNDEDYKNWVDHEEYEEYDKGDYYIPLESKIYYNGEILGIQNIQVFSNEKYLVFGYTDEKIRENERAVSIEYQGLLDIFQK